MAQTPEHSNMPKQLLAYWTSGKGAVLLHWGTPGDFDACRRIVGKYVPAGMVDGMCANIHRHATGGWPGHAPGLEQALSAARKKS
jgi:hypothetical protein